MSRRAGVCAAHSVNQFVFSVPDLAEAERFYAAFGLDVRAHNEQLDLYTFNHPHRWATVVQAPGPKRLQFVSYGVFAEDVQSMQLRAREAGLTCDPHALHSVAAPEGFWLRDPDGVATQIVVASKVSPSVKTTPSPINVAPRGKGAAPSRSMAPVIRPRYLSHVLRYSPDVPRMTRFCEEVLGLRLSDRSGDGIAFIHTPHGSDHHLVAFAKSHAPGLHHSSWDVASIDEVGQGAEQMREAGWGQGWGVGRHVLGSNHFHYVRDPWGSYAEYSSGIDFVPPDLDWPAADHPPADSFYVWGPPPPEDFVTNYEVPAQ